MTITVTIIVHLLNFSNFTLITSMFIVKLTLFFHYVDWSMCHFEPFSIFVLQCAWLVLSKWPH